MSADRYARLDSQADAGLGADEFEGPARFTRPSERTTHLVDSSNIHMGDASGMTLDTMLDAIEDGRRDDAAEDEVLDPRVRLRMLDQAAALLHEVLAETPRSDRWREGLRALAFAAKDLADEINREMTVPATTDSAKNRVTAGKSTTHEKEK